MAQWGPMQKKKVVQTHASAKNILIASIMGKIFTWAIKIYRNSRKYMWEYEQFET